MELYIGNNVIQEIREVSLLKPLGKLIILDISGNQMCREKNYRIYTIFHLKKLKVLDGVSIEYTEQQVAKEMFAGRLTEEILEQRSGGRQFVDIRELDLTSCKLRDFDEMFDSKRFPNLRELNLSHNYLATLRGFGHSPRLKILQVSANRLETLFINPTEDGAPRGLLGLPV